MENPNCAFVTEHRKKVDELAKRIAPKFDLDKLQKITVVESTKYIQVTSKVNGQERSIELKIFHTGIFGPGSPALIDFPGTGHIAYAEEVNTAICKRIAAHTNYTVISVRYSLAPECAFPCDREDVLAVMQHLSKHADAYGIDKYNISLLGYSAGAALAIWLMQFVNKIIPQIRNILLISPLIDYSLSLHSHQDNDLRDPKFKKELINKFINCYLSKQADKSDASISPISSINQLYNIKTTIITGENDVLRSHSEHLFSLLKKASSKIVKLVLPDKGHFAMWEDPIITDMVSNILTLQSKGNKIMHQKNDLEITSNSIESVEIIDNFYASFFSGKASAGSTRALFENIDNDHETPLLKIFASILHNLGQNQVGFTKAKNILSKLTDLFNLNYREKLYLDIAHAGANNDQKRVIELCWNIILSYPQDFFAALLTEFYCFEYGWPEKQLEVMEYIKDTFLNDADPLSQYAGCSKACYLASYGFALVLNNKTNQGEMVIEDALKIDSHLPWAIHAKVHLLTAQNNIDKAVYYLDQSYNTAYAWNDASDFKRGHIWFHKGLLHLERGEIKHGLKIYQEYVWSNARPLTSVYLQTDAILYLIACEISGIKIPKDDWCQILASSNTNHSDSIFPFLKSIYTLVQTKCSVSNKLPMQSLKAMRHLEMASKVGSIDEQRWKIGRLIATAFYYYGKNELKKSIMILDHVLSNYHKSNFEYDVRQIGGSDEQRRIFQHFYQFLKTNQLSIENSQELKYGLEANVTIGHNTHMTINDIQMQYCLSDYSHACENTIDKNTLIYSTENHDHRATTLAEKQLQTNTASDQRHGWVSGLASVTSTLLSWMPRSAPRLSIPKVSEQKISNDSILVQQPTLTENKNIRFDYGKYDDQSEHDAQTNEPIFTYRVYRNGASVGSIRLYGQPMICTDEAYQRNNILEATGELSNFALTREMDMKEICRVLPSTLLDRVVLSAKNSALSGATQGAMRGGANVIGLTLQSVGTSRKIADYISQSIYFFGFFTLRWNHYLAEVKTEETTDYLTAMYKAAVETGQVLLTQVVINKTCELLQSAGEFLVNNGWNNTGVGIQRVSYLANKFGILGWNSYQQGGFETPVSAVKCAVETTVSIAAGAVTQTVIEQSAVASINYMTR